MPSGARVEIVTAPQSPELDFVRHLPPQHEVLKALVECVWRSDQWRWVELGCSIAAGRGDELSDLDLGIGRAEPAPPDVVERDAVALVQTAVPVVDVLAHRLPGSPPDVVRVAAECSNGVQLDLVAMPASQRPGHAEGSIVLVDKDGTLAASLRPAVADPPTATTAREWVMLGWWGLSDVAKYVTRGSFFEAVERLSEVRALMLRVFAAGQGVPYPSYGLVSLFDFEPFEVPEGLARTYPRPDDPAEVLDAALATADLLDETVARVQHRLGYDLGTPWSRVARDRLSSASAST
jgi:hypothetical protein